MYIVTKSFTFDAAHRLMGYDGPCAELHGHTYTATIEFAADYLDEIGFVIDFSDIKKHVKTWVDANWDHGTLLSSEDSDLVPAILNANSKLYLFEKKNPTAEIIAETLFDVTYHMIPDKEYYLRSVEIKETPTSVAIYTPY